MMNYQKLIQSIANREMNIQIYKNKIQEHKNYFSQLKSSQPISLNFLIIPFLIGMRAGRSHWHMKYKAARYSRLLAVSVISYFQNRIFVSLYSHVEQFIKNKLTR